ncbi:hypothetical protein HYH02_002398 [Chlamydomonas schloesseri]|uniref:J domain-containing protein n=1 Tax=Chlamydomonas schloesseri TaxID=2026947 RepID=A0A836BBL0_9CHLO|nr:hypothetical protein HYH02_002398 [Chlamydomonas schloesseri]|eukprot:KAG2453065.1 hypothetical protein HYH02_002398 [Chlamydomonas schloesseri]
MTTQSLYEVLGVEKNATQAEIKKAYRQRALQLHPDKNPDNEDAKVKFQLLQKVYAILGDEEKRKVYDDTGSTDDDDLAGAGFDGLVDYFRAMFGIKTEDIDDFVARYQGGEEERSDLLRYYSQFRGRMSDVFDHLMCSDPDLDSHRLMDIINAAIEAGEVERYKPYTSWAKQVATKPRPAVRVRNASGAGASGSRGGAGAGAGAGGTSNALVAAIQAKRAAAANSFFDSLAAKYGGGAAAGAGKAGKAKGGKAKGGEVFSEPTDEEFEAARRRVVAKKQAGGKKAAGGKKGRVVVVDDDEEEDEDSDEDMEEIEADGSDEGSMDVSAEEEAEEKPRAKKAGGGSGTAKGGVHKAKGKDTVRGSDQRGSVKPKAKHQGRDEEKENKVKAESAGAAGKAKDKGGSSRKGGEKRRQEQGVQPAKKAKRTAA